MAGQLLAIPATPGEAAFVVSLAARHSGTDQELYRRVLGAFREGRRAEVVVSRWDIAVAAGARGGAAARGMCDRDAWREALAADLDRLVRGVAGTDVR